jgi:hypothetical protein
MLAYARVNQRGAPSIHRCSAYTGLVKSEEEDISSYNHDLMMDEWDDKEQQ